MKSILLHDKVFEWTKAKAHVHVPDKFLQAAKSPIASQSPWIPKARGKPEGRMRRNSESDAASSSQARLQDAYLGGLMDTATGKLAATRGESGENLKPGVFKKRQSWRNPSLVKNLREKPNASSKSDCQGGPKAERKEWSHNLHVSPATVHHTEALFSIIRGKHDDSMDDLDVKLAIWGIFLNTTLRAAVHLGQDREANLRYVKNHFWNSVDSCSMKMRSWSANKKKTLVKAQSISKIVRRCRQACCAVRLIRSPTPKPSSSPTLCSVRGKWEMILLQPGGAKLNGLRKTITSRIWIESMVCRRSSSGRFAGITTLGLLEKIQSLMRDLQCKPEFFTDRIIFMSMYNDIAWGAERKQRKMWIQFTNSCGTCSQIPSRSLVFLWAWIRKNGTEPTPTNQTDPVSKLQRTWWQISQDPVIQYFEPPVPLREENYEAKEEARSQHTSMVGMKTSSCFSAQWFLRISSVSTEQWQIYATKYPKILGLLGNLQHQIIWRRWRFLLAFLLEKLRPMHSNGETWCTNTSENSNNCQKTRNYPNYVLMRVWSLSKQEQYFYILDTEEGPQMQQLCREYTMPRNEKKTRGRGWILKSTRIGPVLSKKVCCHDDRYSIEVAIPSLIEDNTASWVRIVNGVDKYVTASMSTKKEEDIASGKPIAKTRPRQKPTVTLTSASIPVLERKLIDIETQRSHDHKCHEVSKAMTRLPLNDQSAPRGCDGANHHSDIIEECRKRKFDDASQWLLEDWISTLA